MFDKGNSIPDLRTSSKKSNTNAKPKISRGKLRFLPLFYKELHDVDDDADFNDDDDDDGEPTHNGEVLQASPASLLAQNVLVLAKTEKHLKTIFRNVTFMAKE